MNLPLMVIVDDDPEILAAIQRVLMRVDIRIEPFTSPRLAIEFIENNQPSIVLSDQRMPDITGLELLKRVKSLWPNTKRIMLSAYRDFDEISIGFNEKVIEHFIAKPWNNKELLLLVSDCLTARKQEGIDSLSRKIIGESLPIKQLLAKVEKAAGANVPIFIHGETGTGKELIARACHELGCKRDGEFVAVNCANFSEPLMESQLFGHKKGAFTGAVADQDGIFAQGKNGTLFLDEITTLPLGLQSKLLRVIQERTYTPLGSLEELHFEGQIISASSTSLTAAVSSGEFREDLFYRLNVVPLSIPKLNEREGDILILAEYFLDSFCRQHGKQFSGFEQEAVDFINSYSWPGNVRQLENLIQSVCILFSGNNISLSMLKELIPNSTVQLASKQENDIADAHTSTSQVMPLQDVEKHAIEQAIEVCEGNVSQAAALLKINPSTLYRKLKSWSE